MEKNRCFWCPRDSALYIEYHDNQWGVPVHDDRLLFEMLSLEGMQAGLSWLSILKKRENFSRAFDGFEIRKVAEYGPRKVEELLADPGIVRNRLKIESIIKNSRAALRIAEEFGSLDSYIWDWVGGRPIDNGYSHASEVPASTDLSTRLSKDLKKRGMNFVGPVIIYSFMQAVGMVNDHETGCFRHQEIVEMSRQ